MLFWSKMLSAAEHLRTDKFKDLKQQALEISSCFITTSVQKADYWSKDEDPLENEDECTKLFEYVATCSRCNYTEIIEELITIFDSLFSEFKTTFNFPNSSSPTVQSKQIYMRFLIF